MLFPTNVISPHIRQPKRRFSGLPDTGSNFETGKREEVQLIQVE